MPLPAIIGAITKFGEKAFAVQNATNALEKMGNTVAALPVAPIKAFSAAISLMNAPILAATTALSEFVGAVGAVGTAVSEFVKFTDPVQVVLFNQAMEDLMASIGMMLVPVLKASTAFVRMFADVIYNLSKPILRLMDAAFGPLEKIFETLTNSMGSVIGVVETLVTAMIPFVTAFMKIMDAASKIVALGIDSAMMAIMAAMEPFLDILNEVAKVVTMAAEGLAKFVSQWTAAIRGMLGLPERKGLEKSSVGAAVRPATIGSVEDYGRKAQQAAFSLGTGGGPEVKTAEATGGLFEYVKTKLIPDLIMAFGKWFAGFPDNVINGFMQAMEALGKQILKLVPPGVREAAESTGDAATNLGRYVGDKAEIARGKMGENPLAALVAAGRAGR